MQAPPKPASESERLAALCDLQILDTGPEERFNRFTRIARNAFNVPMAIISLVDAERQWFKSRLGLAATETPRDISFCGHAILNRGILQVQNALVDVRFADNPLVTGGPNIRFYAGAPLTAGGDNQVGTLCILDTKPREFSAMQLDILSDLAECVAQELSQVKLTEAVRDLAEQRLYTESILNSVNEGIIAIDRHGIVRSINPAAERMFGYDAEHILGHSFQMLVTPEHANELYRTLQQHLEGSESRQARVNHEVEALRKDGSKFPAGLSIGEMEISGRPMFNGVVRDISSRKKLDRMKNEFISTVSHEIRTPLTSIMGSLGLITGGAFGDVPEDIRTMLDVAHNSSDRLVRLVNEMLDVDRMDSGQAESPYEPADLVALTHLAFAEIEGFQREYQVKLVCSNESECAWVLGDADCLLRVITNLLSNAIKFSPPGEQIDVVIQRNQARQRLIVRDSGPGIPVEYDSSIFQRFTQVDSSDSRAENGTGLGLSIAKAIIDQHGGTIGFYNNPDRGTSFYFELPEHSADELQQASASPMASKNPARSGSQ